MKKTTYFLCGIFIYIGMVLLFSSYGNIVAHRSINEGIIEKFKSRFLDGIFTLEKFKNYHFLLDGSAGLTGMSVGERGTFSAEEKSNSFSPKAWIIEGGYSADEPEFPASLRHFYDPTEPGQQRYLKDHLGRIESKVSLTFNPRIDHIEWATTSPNHPYNWENGKANLKKALETGSQADRDSYMAFAWRALGETLHMIADMGCPPHVRDDAHPSFFADYYLLNEYGNSDPYESICEQLTESMIDWSRGNVDEDLKSKFRQSKTVNEIAHDLADYTNKNFFTTQTISGSGVIPKIHPEKTYPKPTLDDCEYQPESYSYIKNISGHEVIMCRDLTYAMYLFEKRGYPYVDRKSVESQAKALMPQIAEAGANTIRLFIPALKIEIEGLDDLSIKGRVIHISDHEYTREIKYNGEIELIKSSNLSKVGTVQCEDGIFNASLDMNNLDVDWESEGLIAQISFGGVYVRSSEYGLDNVALDYPTIWVELRNEVNPFTSTDGETNLMNIIVENFDYNESSSNPDWIGRLHWTGNSFSAVYQEELFGEQFGVLHYHYDVNISGRISDDHKKLEYFNGRIRQAVDHDSIMDNTVSVSELILHNVPLRVEGEYFVGNHSGIDLTEHVEKVYFSYKMKYENSKPESFYEVTEATLNDPEIKLKIRLH